MKYAILAVTILCLLSLCAGKNNAPELKSPYIIGSETKVLILNEQSVIVVWQGQPYHFNEAETKKATGGKGKWKLTPKH
jgi:hypothetical protein